MKFLPFVLKHLAATWVRTASTIISMALCVFLFCTLQSVLTHLDGFIEGRSPRRIVTRNAMSLIGVVPVAHGPRIAGSPVDNCPVENWMINSLSEQEKIARF